MEFETCQCCVARPAVGPVCTRCGWAACRACHRTCTRDVTHDSACVKCRRPWDCHEAVAYLGRTFWNTDFRRIRAAALSVQDAEYLGRDRGHAEYLQRERAGRATVRTLAALVQNGHTEHVPALVQAQRDLRALTESVAPSSELMRCTAEGCGGVLTDAGGGDGCATCPQCARTVCATCHAALAPGERAAHRCDPRTVASLEAIRRTCRACPRCNAPCYRAEGCPTMWCYACHAFWNWETRRIITSSGVPHNPDHAEFGLRGERRRNVHDITCGGIPDEVQLWRPSLARDQYGVMHSWHTSVLVAQRLRHRYPCEWDPEGTHRGHRLRFLMGELTERQYHTSLERAERMHRFKRDVGLVLETYVYANADTMQRWVAGFVPLGEVLLSILSTVRLTDESLRAIGEAYARSVVRLSTRLVWFKPRKGARVA